MLKRLMLSLDDKKGEFFFSSSVNIEAINPQERVQFVAVLCDKIGVKSDDLMSVIGMLDYVKEQREAELEKQNEQTPTEENAQDNTEQSDVEQVQIDDAENGLEQNNET